MKTNWTNPTIRKYIGECGFQEVRDERKTVDDVNYSIWRRGQAQLKLRESLAAPELFDMDNEVVDPETLGVRNPNIQTGEHP